MSSRLRFITCLAALSAVALAYDLYRNRRVVPKPVAVTIAPSPVPVPEDVPPFAVGRAMTAIPPVPTNSNQRMTPLPPIQKPAPRANRPRNNNQPAPQPSAPDTNLAAPEARVALSYVGMDPDANSVWFNAINDPNVPADERKDLIEDLNEDGFADPHHLTPDDLSLILSRIRMIESVGPNAMDDTNLAAFQEAYKDLTNMLSDPNPK